MVDFLLDAPLGDDSVIEDILLYKLLSFVLLSERVTRGLAGIELGDAKFLFESVVCLPVTQLQSIDGAVLVIRDIFMGGISCLFIEIRSPLHLGAVEWINWLTWWSLPIVMRYV